MAVVKVYDQNNKEAGEVTLAPEVFEIAVRPELLHLVVRAQLAAQRAGTHATKTRAFVSGGGRKPFRQKGTGNARQGSERMPQHTGGGIVHGPKPRDYSQRTPKQMIAAALRGALSDRVRGERVTVLNLTVHAIDIEKGLMLVKGAVPGARGRVVFVRNAVKGA